MTTPEEDGLTFWVVEFSQSGTYFWITPEEAQSLDQQVTDDLCSILRFTDINGARCVFQAQRFVLMYESSPFTRAETRRIDALVRAEHPEVPGVE